MVGGGGDEVVVMVLVVDDGGGDGDGDGGSLLPHYPWVRLQHTRRIQWYDPVLAVTAPLDVGGTLAHINSTSLTLDQLQ